MAAPDLIYEIIRDVAELPDRTSPDDWPEAMLVTADELRLILERHLSERPSALALVNCRVTDKHR